MSEDTKAAKEQRCRELLTANPDLSMKEANVSIREEFGTGVAPTTFSKIKKELKGDEAPASEPKKEEKKVSDSKAKVKSSVKKKEAEAPQKEKADEPEEEGASEEKSDEKPSDENNQKKPEREEPAPPPVIVEEEIDPNLPKFPVHLEILVPSASTVNLSGSFNLWRTDEHPLKNSGEDFWVFDGELPQGEWHYKFVVDGRVWFLDIHKKKVTDRTGVSHPIQVGDPLPKEDSNEGNQEEEAPSPS
jgi:hypothetical protein